LLITAVDRLKELTHPLVLVIRDRFETGLGWKRQAEEVQKAQGALWKNKRDAQTPTALPVCTWGLRTRRE